MKVIVGAFNQEQEVPSRGLFRDCENRWIDCSSTVYTGTSREVATVDRWVQQQTETDAGVNTVKMLSPGLPRLHKTVWTLTSGAILSRAYTISWQKIADTGKTNKKVGRSWRWHSGLQCGSIASGCKVTVPPVGASHLDLSIMRLSTPFIMFTAARTGTRPGQEESF